MRNIIIIMMIGIFAALCFYYFPKGDQRPVSSQTQEQYLQSQGVGAPQIPQPSSGHDPILEPASKSGVQKFVVYTIKGDKGDHFVPSGWMGDRGDLVMHDPFTGNCHSRATASVGQYDRATASVGQYDRATASVGQYDHNGCIQFVYNAQKAQGAGWVGVYWQNPANNWGEQRGGYDLVGMKKLTFWARGENGTEQIDQFLVGGITGQYPDSAKVVIGPVKLTKGWQQYTIDLLGHDFSYINGAFGFIISSGLNPGGCAFYLDTIQFEGTSIEMK